MDRLALWGDQIMLLSVAGPETSIKAVHACLSSSVPVRFDTESEIRRERSLANPAGDERTCPSMVRHPSGYTTYRSRLGYNTWHLLALSRAEGFLPCLSETALHEALRSSRYSTPYLRSWVPWLADRLADAEEKRLLHLLDGFQTQAALLQATNDDLDSVISMGVRDGFLTLPALEAA
jgi:hypothetical protein